MGKGKVSAVGRREQHVEALPEVAEAAVYALRGGGISRGRGVLGKSSANIVPR